MEQVKLYLFGTPRVAVNEEPVELNLRKGLALLVYVAVTRQPHSRDTLATLLWPEKDQQAARANLRRTLYELSQLLGEKLFEVAAEKVTLYANSSLWLDIERFQKCLAESLPLHLSSYTSDALHLMRLVEAADLYTADFMAGFTLPDCPEFDDWQFFQREALRSSFTALMQHLVFIHEAQGKWEEAMRYARRWLALDPLEETVHRRLMQLYAQAGQASAALRQYEECVRILGEELDVSPEAETTALYEAIRTRRFPVTNKGSKRIDAKQVVPDVSVTLSSHPSVTVSPVNSLPTQTTPFVGRQQELAEIVRHLRDADCRLLSLVGPGGIGKTRLAIEVAKAMREFESSNPSATLESVQSQFKDSTFFVPLQPVNTPSGIASAIAGTLGLQFYSGAPAQQQLLQFLQEKELLLVLDNFEHLLAGAELVVEILATAPKVKMLVTSREALKLHEEWFHPLAGMRLPASTRLYPGNGQGVGGTQETIAGYDAIQLFVQTARRAQVTFEPATQLQEIVRICRLVDGMPLGIELAASWLKVLSCAQIANEIESGIDILVTRHQNVPARHRSMRVVLEHSWQLLGEEAQRALRRLSVFRGGFLQDAAAVAGAKLLTLADLVDKSWIYRTPSGRYQMHELLRQYAADHLAEVPYDEAEMQERHSVFYLRQIAQFEVALVGPEQRKALDRIDAEIDNVQAAWTRAITGRSFNLINTALHALYLFFQTRSRYAEGEELFLYALHQLEKMSGRNGETNTVSDTESDTESVSVTSIMQLSYRLLVRLGEFYLCQGELAAANRSLTVVLSKSQDSRELAYAYAGLGKIARLQGNRSAADAALHQSLTLARAVGDLDQMAEALKVLSDIAASWADFVEGKQFAEEALLLCRQLQRPDLTAQVLAALAWAINCLGDYAESERYYRESLAVAEAIASPFGIALATNFLGWVAFCAGGARLPEALSLYGQAMAIWRQIGQRSNLAMCLADYALAANEDGDYATALRYAQEGLDLTVELSHFDLMSYNLYCLGAAMCGLDDLVASHRYLLRSLQISSKAQIPDNMVATLYFVVQLRIKESKVAGLCVAEQLKKQGEAMELLALIIQHRATWQLFRDRALRVQAELVEILPVDVAAAAIERGKQRTIAEVVTEIFDQADDQWHKDDQVVGKV